MNQSFVKRCQFVFASALAISLAGCHSQGSADSAEPPGPTTLGSQEFILSGGVANVGPHALLPGDSVATVLARNVSASPGKPITIVLIRRAPEGKTRQLIQLDSDGRLMDPKQDLALRNGDELLFPGGAGAGSGPNAGGPPQRGPG